MNNIINKAKAETRYGSNFGYPKISQSPMKKLRTPNQTGYNWYRSTQFERMPTEFDSVVLPSETGFKQKLNILCG